MASSDQARTKIKPPTDRVRVRRLPDRADYDPTLIGRVLDEALIGHVGFEMGGQPFVIPVTFVRVGENVYLHGSAASRMLEHGAEGVPLCFTVTLLDGLVFARSAFHHSMNYRSVVILGRAKLVTDPAKKREVLELLVNRFSPERSRDVRGPNDLELKATHVLELPISEASAKVRSGGPKDDAEDMTQACWAGVVPLAVHAGPPVTAIPAPESSIVPTLASSLEIR